VEIKPAASAPSQSRSSVAVAREAPGVTTQQTDSQKNCADQELRFARSAVQPVSRDSLRCREMPQAKILRRPVKHTQVFHRFSTIAQRAEKMDVNEERRRDFNCLAIARECASVYPKKDFSARPCPAARIRTIRMDRHPTTSDRLRPESWSIPDAPRWEYTFGN
jgi:hypothetical protein